jgi:GT2 family glycosyltransferase
LFTVSLVSHRQGDLAQRMLDDLARTGALLDRVVITRNLPERWQPACAHPGATLETIDNPQPRGFGANHNAAFARCASEWFVVANPDLRLPADPLPALLAAAAPGVGLVAPLVREPDGSVADSARTLPTPAALLRRYLPAGLAGTASRAATATARQPGSGESLRPAPGEAPLPPAGQAPLPPPSEAPHWYAGMFLAIRSEAFEAIGGFDERYHLYCEDVDLCARLRLAGWQLRQARDAVVVHDARRASRRSLRHLGWHLASMTRLWRSDAWRRYRALIASEGAPLPMRAPGRD